MTVTREAKRWLGEHVRAFYANDRTQTRFVGRVVAYSYGPQVLAETPDGEKEWWGAELCEIVEDPTEQPFAGVVGQAAGAQLVEAMESLVGGRPPAPTSGMPVLVGIDRDDAAAFVRLLHQLQAIKTTVGQPEDYRVLERVLDSAASACRFNGVRMPGYEWRRVDEEGHAQ